MREVGQAKELVEKMLTFIEQVSHRKLKFSSIVDMNTGATSDPTDRLVAAVDAALRRAKAEGVRLSKHEYQCWEDAMWSAETKDVVTFGQWIDARAAQIEEGE